MKCGCGAKLTGRTMRAYFTICAEQPAASDQVDRRGRTLRLSADTHEGRG
jgi:hypothetical protein